MTLMKLYAFSDFHLSGDPPTKPMDIFGPAWNNHREKIINAWMETIHPEDTVIMAGDLSWAMHIQDAISDLKMLGTLPGRKIIVRGNHDYWWDTVTKMTRMTDGAFEFIYNSARTVGPIAIAGTRGWIAAHTVRPCLQVITGAQDGHHTFHLFVCERLVFYNHVVNHIAKVH